MKVKNNKLQLNSFDKSTIHELFLHNNNENYLFNL